MEQKIIIAQIPNNSSLDKNIGHTAKHDDKLGVLNSTNLNFITTSFCFTSLHYVVYSTQKFTYSKMNYWRRYKLAVWRWTTEPYKKKFRDVSPTLQHSVTGSPAQPTTENTKNNLQREARHLLSSQWCVVMGEKEPEVWMIHLAMAKPVIGCLHEGGRKLLLLRPIRWPNRAPQFVGCQSKDWQC